MSHLTTTSGAALVTKIFAAFLINLTSRSSNFNFTCSIKTTGYLKSLSLQYPFLGYPPVKIHNLFTNRINNPLHCGSAKVHFLVTATLSLSCRSPPVSKRKAVWVADWLIGVEWALPPSSPVVQRRAGTGKHPGYCRKYPRPPPKKKKWTCFTIFPWKKRTPFEEEMNQLKKKYQFLGDMLIFMGGIISLTTHNKKCNLNLRFLEVRNFRTNAFPPRIAASLAEGHLPYLPKIGRYFGDTLDSYDNFLKDW